MPLQPASAAHGTRSHRSLAGTRARRGIVAAIVVAALILMFPARTHAAHVFIDSDYRMVFVNQDCLRDPKQLE